MNDLIQYKLLVSNADVSVLNEAVLSLGEMKDRLKFVSDNELAPMPADWSCRIWLTEEEATWLTLTCNIILTPIQ